MSTTSFITAGLALVFVLFLLGGYQTGSDAAKRDNRADAQVENQDTPKGNTK